MLNQQNTQNRQDPEVIRSLREYRLALIAREENQIERLAKSWLEIEKSMSDDMLLLALQIQQEKLKGSVITEQLLRRMDRYQKLNSQMKSEILTLVKDTAIPDIEIEQFEYGQLAIQSASEAIRLSTAYGVQFDKLPSDAVETYVGHLGDGTPLYRLLKEAYPDSLDGVVKALLEGTSKGLNPNEIAFNMARSMGLGLERITLIARTEQLRVARLVSAQQYRESGLNGYMRRVATKDDRVCMACLVSDGEIITLDKELEDHPRGRCVAIFQIKGAPEIQWEKGPDWFEKQSEDLQKEMMGNDKWEAWQEGKFDLKDLRQNSFSDIWGTSPRTPSLKEIAEMNRDTFGMPLEEAAGLIGENSPVNHALRFGRELSEREKEIVEALDNGMKTSNDVMRIYRGLDAGTTREQYKRIFGNERAKEGTIFTDKGFPSTSTDKSIALRFAKKKGDSPVLLTIYIEPGTPFLPMGNMAQHAEREILLGRGLEYEITKRTFDEKLGVEMFTVTARLPK